MTRRKPSHQSRESPRESDAQDSPRRTRGRIRLFGLHTVAAALVNPRRRCRKLIAIAAAAEKLASQLSQPLKELNVNTKIVTRAEINRMFPEDSVHQGILLEADPLPRLDLNDALAARSDILVFLDQVTDPRNVGAVLRSAAAFGAGAVILTGRHAPGESGALAKAASGALDIVPLIRLANLASGLREAKTHGFWCIGLDPSGHDTLARASEYDRVALVLGAEGTGLRRLTREHCDVIARLAISGAVGSLNVAAAAAVALYAVRNRHAPVRKAEN